MTGIGLFGDTQFTMVQAGQVKKGDIIVNLGVVDKIVQSGVFRVFAVRGMVWSLARGTGETHTLDHVFHEADFVVLGLPR